MEDIKIFIHYLKKNIITFCLVILSPKSSILSIKIRDKNNTLEILLYLIFTLVLINSFYLRASGVEILSISLVQLVFLSFCSFLIQALILWGIHNAISRKKEEYHIFLHILALGSTFNLVISGIISAALERDFLQITRAVTTYGGKVFKHFSYSPTIPTSIGLTIAAFAALILLANVFFISIQLKVTTESTFKKSFFVGITAYTLNGYLLLKTYGLFSFFILDH